MLTYYFNFPIKRTKRGKTTMSKLYDDDGNLKQEIFIGVDYDGYSLYFTHDYKDVDGVRLSGILKKKDNHTVFFQIGTYNLTVTYEKKN